MALGINGINQNIFVKPQETISGEELTRVTKELFSKTSSLVSSSSSSQSSIGLRSGVDVSLYGFSASSDTNAIKSVATNRAGLDVELSQKTLSALSSLNARAANDALYNISQLRNGMIHINNIEQPDFTGLKNTFALSNKPEVFETMNLSKDRKGSSPFYVPQDAKKDSKNIEKTESVNFLA